MAQADKNRTMEELDFTIQTLGQSDIQSPVSLSKNIGDYMANYVEDDYYILYDIASHSSKVGAPGMLEIAGPREKIFFDPAVSKAAIVTCGGLCPGLNDVIRSIVMCLWYRYRVKSIFGVKFGYRGFLPQFDLPMVKLTPKDVQDIHQNGGTLLGSSRGYGDHTTEIVDTLEKMGINMLFTIGGDGTQKGALNISNEALKRGLKLAVVGVPKTIDNDLSFIQQSFGFETAVSRAVEAVAAAHVEAFGAINGVGVVKVMGRQSGFIAAHTALAINDVNFVLVPEVPFELDGDNGLLAHLETRLNNRNHAVILVAEGAGQDLMQSASNLTDASGNIKLGDIGIFLKDKITSHFKAKGVDINLRYIDPSYMIRSAPANPHDSIYCARLGTNAVHAAMAGRTGVLIGLVHNQLVHVPIHLAVSRKNAIDPDSELWRDVIEATGQPPLMKN
ncbi:MAG: ATP-dependent 6-phosphofructokinase [Sedimentisphaerales bacterium]|nr:ATP-dependent 6-phosphofructokinase [Sedimentisphaerales bacterium]